ncbi:SDR family NAD(P)-dependent oxidoreductase [Flexithrix dorotheae]|uniref:SDR family NAD(P)-dependent oxidoreductase n=1 Tax=Flexithrix dorotheae TaxID=70993 RepID=UPI0012F94B58|nr:SDR family NAD(P)-dependent oxidoreductase [Flexithrix dorotheae]
MKNIKHIKKKWSLRKKIIITLSIPLILFLFFYFSIILLFVSKDTSKDTPLYVGEIISDTLQQPLINNFGHSTTAMEVVEGIDLSGKIIVMTGGHTGTGLQATKAFISKGATVVALTPDVELAKNNLDGLPNVEIEYLNLLDIKSIDAFVIKFLNSNRPIHTLINSAGLFSSPLHKDERGYEKIFAVNVLGHYELSLKLLPALKKANGSRIINLSSRGHRLTDINFEDINFEYTKYDNFLAYCQSKTAVSLVSVKQDELFKKYNIRSFSVHPGAVPSSDLFTTTFKSYASIFQVCMADMAAKSLRVFYGTELLNYLRKPKNEGDIYKTVQQGGATTVWAAVDPQLNGKGGQYLEDCNIAQMVPNGSDAPFGVRPWALNKQSANQIWEICEKMTGVYFE